MPQICVPPYFLCPISLELMHDPVVLTSGQTFDRLNIERWLDDGHCSCPITRQPLLPNEEPIPNHALRRIIQSWCVENTASGVQRIATPKQPVGRAEIQQLVDQITGQNASMEVLQRLSTIADGHRRARKQLLEAGVLSRLASSLGPDIESSSSACSRENCFTRKNLNMAGETLRLLASLLETEGATEFWDPSGDQVTSIAWFLANGNAETRFKAAAILSKSARKIWDDTVRRKVGGMEGLMGGVIELVKNEGEWYPKASMIGMMLLLGLCSSSTRNRVVAAEEGAVEALVEILKKGISGEDKRRKEMAMECLETLCMCAQGRAKLVCKEKGLIEEVVKMIGGFSRKATLHAMRIVWLVVKWAPSESMATTQVLQAGAFTRILILAQTTAASSSSCGETLSTAHKILSALTQALLASPSIHLPYS